MRTVATRSAMPATAAELFAWHARPHAFARLNPPFDRAALEERTGGLEPGARTVLRVTLGPIERRWIAVHTACEEGRMFRDEQVDGPFRRFVHTHRFFDGELEDVSEFELPLGAGAIAGAAVEGRIRRAFAYRHAVTRMDLSRHAPFRERARLTVAITGASGLVGAALTAYLDTAGHRVVAIKRGDFSAVDGCDAVVHLAGASIARRWGGGIRAELVHSRVDYTRALVEALGRAKRRPAVLISASAIGVYGDRGDEELDERSKPGARGERGAAFVAGLCADWEAEAEKAAALGLRVVTLRTGIVLTSAGGALATILPGFRAGAGGPLGDGRHFMSWVSMEDVLGAIEHALMTQALAGPINLTAPAPVTNAELSSTLGRVLGRPSFVRVPAFSMRLLFGEAADAALLASQRVKPWALEASGFRFVHPSLESCLRFTLGKPSAPSLSPERGEGRGEGPQR